MIRTCILACLACALASGRVEARTISESQTAQAPAAQSKPRGVPDDWKFEKEKAAEQKEAERRKAAGDKRGGEESTQKAGKGQPTKGAAATAKPRAPWRGWSDRAYISLNGGYQASSDSFGDSREFEPGSPGDSERRTLSADYAVEAGTSIDMGGAVRLWKGLGAGVAVTRYEDSRDIQVEGSIPHPFFFDRDRMVSGTAPGSREETAVHLSAVWVVPAGRRMQIAIFGGPSFYSVKQTVVTDFTFSESYPYDEATLTRVVTEEADGSVTGFHAGADVSYYFTRYIGVGGIVRFGRASFDSAVGSLDVGGPSFGGGLRIRIPR